MIGYANAATYFSCSWNRSLTVAACIATLEGGSRGGTVRDRTSERATINCGMMKNSRFWLSNGE